jgi:hypothetical protein
MKCSTYFYKEHDKLITSISFGNNEKSKFRLIAKIKSRNNIESVRATSSVFIKNHNYDSTF